MNIRWNVERCMEKTAQPQGYRDEARSSQLVRVHESCIRNKARAMCGGEVDAAIGSSAIVSIGVRRFTYLLVR